jgi:hypothetical protein
MKGSGIVSGAVVVIVLLVAAAAGASPASAPRDGYYAPLGTTVGSADVELFVIANGTQVADSKQAMGVGLSCDLDPAEQADGLNPGAAYVNVYVPLGRKLAIHGRSFSYSGPAYLPAFEIPAGVKQPAGTIAIKGTFKPASEITGKTVDKKTIAFTGTVSATLCPSIPTTFKDYWSQTD